MEYATIHKTGPVHLASITPLSKEVVRIKVSAVIPDYPYTWNSTVIDFYANLLLTGTEKRTKEGIEAYLKKYGITLSVTSSMNTVTFSVIATREHLKKALALLTEIIWTPQIDTREFKLRKQMLLEENREAHDDAKRITEIQFYNTLYPKNSFFSAPTLAEERTHIEAVTPALLKKLQKTILSGEWYLTLVGSPEDLRAAQPLVTKLERTAHAVPTPDITIAPARPQSVYTTVPGKTNVEVRIGNILPITARDDDYIPFSFGLRVLGKVGGFAGRLMSIVREKEGLTYGIYARIANVTNEHAGHWNIFTFFTARDLAQGITSTLRELTAIVRDGITEDELVRFKEITKNQHLIAHGSDASRLMFYHGVLMDHETPADVARDMERTARLTRDEVHAALLKYINPSALIISGAGPVTKNGKGIMHH